MYDEKVNNASLKFSAYDIANFKKMYKLGPELGRGGFGTVYSGFRIKDGLPVAVKFVGRHNVTEWSTVSASGLSFPDASLIKAFGDRGDGEENSRLSGWWVRERICSHRGE